MPKRIVCFSLLGVAVAVSLVFMTAEVRMLQIPAQRDYGEGQVLWMSQQITNAERAYKPIDRLPYVVFPYPPLYLLASRTMAVVFADPLVAGRILSLVCTVGIAVVVALTVFCCLPTGLPRIWRLTSAACGAALTLCMDSVAGWGGLMRVDMLALFLMFAGLAVYIVLGMREQWQYVAALLFVLAVFTKQTMLSAPIACAIFGLVTNHKATIRVYGFAIILGLSALFFCNSITQGGFMKNVVDYNLSPFSWEIALGKTFTHLQANSLSVVIAVAALLSLCNVRAVSRFGWKGFLRIRSSRNYDRAIFICGLHYLLAAVWTLSIGKMGSAYNFFLAWDISACSLCGLFLFRLLATWKSHVRYHQALYLALVMMFFLMLLPSRWVVIGLTHRFDAEVKEQAQITQLIRTTPGPVLSENLLAVTKAGKDMQIEPATVSFLVQAGRWDERSYLQLLEQQYFQLIVTLNLHGNERYTPAMTSSIKKAYSLEQKIGHYSIYRPRKTR